jgi:hypothetical protein
MGKEIATSSAALQQERARRGDDLPCGTALREVLIED